VNTIDSLDVGLNLGAASINIYWRFDVCGGFIVQHAKANNK